MLFYVLFYFLITSNEGARILGVFPTPSISHQVVFRPLSLELAKRGHELVILTTDPVFAKGQAPINYTEIDVHDISYGEWREGFVKLASGKPEDLNKQAKIALNILNNVFVRQLLTSEFQELLKSDKKFDLLILEGVVRSARILTHVFDAPAVLINSMAGVGDFFDVFGIPNHPLLYPALTRQRVVNLTFWEKINEIYNNYILRSIWDEVYAKEDALVEKIFGPNMPKLDEMVDNVALALLNVHSIWDHNRPAPPNVVYVGGIHQKPHKELPTDLKNYLDSSKNGVIYLSFGTNVIPSLLPPERIQILIKVFSQLPYDVLWKWDKDVLPGKSENIKISKWLPQSDLLRHPKVKLFITQGGLQSTEEAITAAVPLIGMPMLGDQWYNVELYKKFKIGLRLDIDELSEEKFKSYIEEVIGDQSYRQNIARLRDQVYDQPQTPLERAVWWTEHVLRHGKSKHLRAAGANLTWSEYVELPFLLTLLAGVLLILVVLISIMLYLYRLFNSFNATIKIKKT